MSVLIYFGGASLVIILGFIVVIRGWRHHYLEAKKNNAKS